MSEALGRTPLHEEHLRLGAKLVPFAGYSMPIQYPGGIQAEHHAVRKAAGLFDVSHMGEFWIEGPGALGLIQALTVNDASRLVPGQAQYSAFCLEDGGVIDDLFVYRLEDEVFLLVVNASNRARDLAWVRSHASGHEATVEDRSDETALLALQGPAAASIMVSVGDAHFGSMRSNRLARGRIAGREGIAARTGYTGEDGFEIFLANDDAPHVWRALLDAGRDAGLVPIGLGARDSLRLEVGYPLYGNDLDEAHTALESGLGWIVKLEKGPFVGRDALRRQKEAGVSRTLVGLVLEENGFPRPGYPVVADGEEVGSVTSGTLSPTLGKGIAMAYVPVSRSEKETLLGIRIRGRDVPARVCSKTFYRGGSRSGGSSKG
jgi:aminomethyltransferase